MVLTKNDARKVLKVVDVGLTHGLGNPVPGKMCVEAAVCFALGLPHSDNPPCVGAAVRVFKITLNDSAWSSNEARAKGMRRLAIAQLGSDTIDQAVFAQRLALGFINKVLPTTLRLVGLEAQAVACAEASTLDDAARAAADAVARAVARAAADAAYADAANRDAARAARAAADAAAYAARDAARDAARAAADAGDARAANRDEVLSQVAEIAVEALSDSPGYAWLDLTN